MEGACRFDGHWQLAPLDPQLELECRIIRVWNLHNKAARSQLRLDSDASSTKVATSSAISSSAALSMQGAGDRRQKLGGYIVQFDHHCQWLLAEDSHSLVFADWKVLRHPCILGIDIDTENYASAVGDHFRSFDCIRQAYFHADVDHCNAGKSGGIVHVGRAGYLLSEIFICEPSIARAIQDVIFGRYA